MKYLRNSVIFALLIILFWNNPISSNAQYGGEIYFTANPRCPGYNIIDGSLSYSEVEAIDLGITILNYYSPSLGSATYLDIQTYTDGSGLYVVQISDNDILTIQQIESETTAWLQNNLPSIVPNGTYWPQAIQICADWVADRMTYDERALTDSDLLTRYQSAITCFTEGTGVCATYTTAFNCMIGALPFDPVTQCVDYSSSNPLNVSTRYVYNEEHAWSAIWINDGWHAFDITFYDNNDGPRIYEYLDMDYDALNDGDHSNYHPIYG